MNPLTILLGGTAKRFVAPVCLVSIVLGCVAPIGGEGPGFERGGKGDGAGKTVQQIVEQGGCSTSGVKGLSAQIFRQTQLLLEALGHGDFLRKIDAKPVQKSQGNIGHSIQSIPYLWGPAAAAAERMLEEEPWMVVTSGFRTVVQQYVLSEGCNVAAEPGSSWHEYGLALDLTESTKGLHTHEDISENARVAKAKQTIKRWYDVAVKHGYVNGVRGHDSHYVYRNPPKDGSDQLLPGNTLFPGVAPSWTKNENQAYKTALNEHWLGDFKQNFAPDGERLRARLPVLAHQILLNANAPEGSCTVPNGEWNESTRALTNSAPANGYADAEYLDGEALRELLRDPENWCGGSGGPRVELSLSDVSEDRPLQPLSNAVSWTDYHAGDMRALPNSDFRALAGLYSEQTKHWYLPSYLAPNPTLKRVFSRTRPQFEKYYSLVTESEEVGAVLRFFHFVMGAAIEMTGEGVTAFNERLRPSDFSAAMRWDYSLMDKFDYLDRKLLVGRCDKTAWAVVRVNEWGPGFGPSQADPSKGRILGLSQAAYRHLNLNADDSCVLAAPARDDASPQGLE